MRPASTSPSRPPARVHVAAAALLVVLLAPLLGGCGDEVATRPAPPPEKLRELVEHNATVLGRVSCSGCPERWETQPCRFTEELVRGGDGLDAARCAVVQPTLGYPGLPERLPPASARALAAGRETLQRDTRHRDIDAALRLYAFGADLQRLGSLELWVDGLTARATAIGWLTEARPDGRWPAELLALEAAAPAPARIADAAVIATYNHLTEPGWSERAGIAVASERGAAVVRAAPDRRADEVRAVRQALSVAWPEGQLPVDLLDAWEASERVRSESIRLALDRTLAQQRQCPASLQALVPDQLPHVPDGWTLEPGSCTALETTPAAPRPAPVVVPVAGAMAAQP